MTILKTKNYRIDIDGLRGLAVISVVIYHAFPTFLSGGFIGVDIFFVISGFLISNIILSKLSCNNFNFYEFFGGRIRRLLPSLNLILISSFTIGWFTLIPSEFQELGKYIAGGAAFLDNFVAERNSGYFDGNIHFKPLVHLWSLGVEEQFYVAWPFLLALAWKCRVSIPVFIALIAIISFGLNILLVASNPITAFYSPLTRFWEILSGGMIAYFSLKPNCFLNSKCINKFNFIISIFGIIIFIFCIFLINKKVVYPGWVAAFPVIAGLLFLINKHSWVNRTILSSRPLVWIGLISYPLYLWHWVIFSYAKIILGGEPEILIQLSLISLSFALSFLTYKFVELPIRYGGHNRIKIFFLVLTLTMIGFAGFNTYQREGLPFRFDMKVQEEFPHRPFFNENCTGIYPEFSSFSTCLLSKNKEPTILLLGDSHSHQYYKAFSQILAEESVMNLSLGSCLPFASEYFMSISGCQEKFKIVLSFLKQNNSIKKIYLTGFWGILQTSEFTPGIRFLTPYNVDDKKNIDYRMTGNNQESFAFNARRILDGLEQKRIDIFLIRDIPIMDFDIESCNEYRLKRKSIKLRQFCGIPKNQDDEYRIIYEKFIDEILSNYKNINVLDPTKTLCDDKFCWAIKNGERLYFDGNHLDSSGASSVVEDFKLLQKN